MSRLCLRGERTFKPIQCAALYAQYFPDATVVAAVNDVEQLTTNLSRKIWQKIVLVQPGGSRNSGKYE